MEGSESTINRVGRALWTVWGYLTGAVGRYLRPEVTNEEAHQVQFKPEDTVLISKCYKELKVKEEEKENPETKTREDLQYSGVRVQASAVQWEEGNIAHDAHEVKEESKHTYPSSERIGRKSQTKKDDEDDADVKNRDRLFCESEEADLNVERSETNQQTKKLEEEKKIVNREFEKTEKEPTKCELVDQVLLAKEADLNVERNECFQEQGREEEEEEEDGSVCEFVKRENEETEQEPIRRDSVDGGILTKEVDVNVKRIKNIQEQRRKQEEKKECDEILKRENDETEEEPIQSEIIDRDLLTEEVGLNVEKTENHQEQRRKSEEAEGGDEISRREYDETGEEPINSEFTEQDLLAKEADLNVERNENNQEQGRKEEEEHVDEIGRRQNDESEEEPITSEFSDEGLLMNEDDLNVERGKYNQEQGRKSKDRKESSNEVTKRENDETEEEPIKDESIDQGLLTEEADLNVERIENSQKQRKKQEEEGDDEISRREYDETGEEPIKSEFTEQDLLAKEADLNVERNENYQEQGRKEEEEEEHVDEIMRRQNDETEEEPITSEFTDEGLLTKEAGLNVERGKMSQEQRRKQEEEEEGVKMMKREYEETGEKLVKSKFFEQGLLAKEADLNVERNENSQDQRRKPEEEEEHVDEISRREYEETEEEPIKSKVDQGLDPGEHCDMGDTAVVQVVPVEKITECVYEQDTNELNVVEQSIHVTTESENEARRSQIVDEGLCIQLASTWEGREALPDSLKPKVGMTENTTLLQEKELIEVNNEKTKQETVEKAKDGYHEEFLARAQFTGTDIAEEQKVCDTEMKETLKQFTAKVVDLSVETECELLETAQLENAEIYKKVSEPSRIFEEEGNNVADTMKLQHLEPSKEREVISEVALNVDLWQLDDTAHDHNGSQPPAVVSKQGVEGIITCLETGTGNQVETVETTSKFRAEVAAVDVKKSAERKISLYEQPIDTEEVAVPEIIGQRILEQESLLQELADTRTYEVSLQKAPFSEIKPLGLKALEQVDETAVESVDEMPSSSLQGQEECSSEAQIQVEAKSSSPERTVDVFKTLREVTETHREKLKSEQAQPECEICLVENNPDETPLEDQITQDECTVQDSATEASTHRLQTGLSDALYLAEKKSEQEMQRDSQKDTEEQERTDEAETGLLAETKDVTSRLGAVEEIMSGLTKGSEDSEWELFKEMESSERKDHKSELEWHEETSESNSNVELLTDTWECETHLVAEKTDIESMMIDSAGGEMESMKKKEEHITEEGKHKRTLDFSASEESKEISKEHEGKVEHEKSLVDSKEEVEERGRPGLKRGFEKMAGDNDEDKPSALTGLLLASQASSLDFSVQKSKIAVKNPLVRRPKDPRMLINMASVEPLTPPHPLQPSFLKKSHIEGASVPSKGLIGFKLPGMGPGFSALRKTEAGRKMRDGEDSESGTSQKSDPGSQSADDNVKQGTPPHKPKWTPPRQPGMGSPLMMAELKSKLKKPVNE